MSFSCENSSHSFQSPVLMSRLYKLSHFEVYVQSMGAVRVAIKGNRSYFHASVKELFCCSLPTLKSVAVALTVDLFVA